MSKDHKKEPFMDLLDRNWLILVNLCRFYSSGETFLFEEMMQEVQLRLWEVYSVTPEKYFRGESAEMTWIRSRETSASSASLPLCVKNLLFRKRLAPGSDNGGMPPESLPAF